MQGAEKHAEISIGHPEHLPQFDKGQLIIRREKGHDGHAALLVNHAIQF